MMSEITPEQQEMLDFVAKMHEQFNKHGAVLRAADGRLEAADYQGFEQTYAQLPTNDLIEIVQAQHIKINEVAHGREQAWEIVNNIMRDVANCRNFVAFGELKRRAQTLIMGQDLVNSGASVEEVKEVLAGGKQIATSNLVQ